MSYVILNGVKSTLIHGLLIQSLPPITKPRIRTSVDEIDGRDGDIVTKLGYSAYNKELSIGLFGDYDIDEIITYFNSEGTVIFSNEPDKYYNYTITEQIDFEKLVSFKTATVTFHVQPFKYSAVDDVYLDEKNRMKIRSHTETKNGVTVTSANGVISVDGTANVDTQFYVPINEMILEAKAYTLNGSVTGSGATAGKIRVIDDYPTAEQSFGGVAIQLASSVTLTDTLTEEKVFHYVWILVSAGTAMDFELSLEMLDDSFNSTKVMNRGNTTSRPKITIYGENDIALYVNSVKLFDIALSNNGYITIDGLQMDAYKGDTLMNRSVSGDYSKLILNMGANVISWTGTVTKIEIEDVSRWI